MDGGGKEMKIARRIGIGTGSREMWNETCTTVSACKFADKGVLHLETDGAAPGIFSRKISFARE
jgi:hypothetical protein